MNVDNDSAGFRVRICSVPITLKACCLLGLVFATSAAAQDTASTMTSAEAEMKSPSVSFAEADWDSVRATLRGLDQLNSGGNAAAAPAAAPDLLARLDAATEKIFPKIAETPVPVLLPFDTVSYLRDAAGGDVTDPDKYFGGFHAPALFFAGPSGYDAMFAAQRRDFPDLDLSFAKPIDVQISGSALLYELNDPALAEEAPAPVLDHDFPGIRRILLESHVRYTFARFGMVYFVSIECFDGPGSARRLSCREADKVALHCLKALNVVGGAPQSGEAASGPQTVERPEQTSPDFTYYAAGDLLPGSGMKGQSGRADPTVYAKIRFPIEQAPAYANSQSFMNWGDCDHTGRVGLSGSGKQATYRCQVNTKTLVHDESKNYAYPWRDNFCEHRYFYVGECPAGLGHQGQDIRPSSCVFRNEGADRCMPYHDNVVAVRDGVIMRAPGDAALYLVVDSPGEHIRFRYLHMNPQMLDAAGMVSGREVSAGEVIGMVGTFDSKYEGGTTYHLHFDVQVPTRDGWVFVNPYMTLVASYERLIGGRGRMVSDETVAASAGVPVPGQEAQNNAAQDNAAQNNAEVDGHGAPDPAAPGAAKLAETSKPSTPDAIVAPNANIESSVSTDDLRKSARGRKTASTGHCTTRLVKGHRRRHCGIGLANARRGRGAGAGAGTGAHARHPPIIRSVDRGVPGQGPRPWHHGGNLRARHEHGAPRPNRA
jgi:hypothetical protein